MKIHIYVRLEWGDTSWWNGFRQEVQSALFDCGCHRIEGWMSANGVHREGYGVGNWMMITVGITKANVNDFERKFKALLESKPQLQVCSFIWVEE